MKNQSISLKSFAVTGGKIARALRPYAGVLFFLLIAAAYGFVILRINSLSTAPVDQSAVDSQAQSAAKPHVDANTIQQLQALKDNSVNVQTLFQDNRLNPFQE